MIGGDMSHWSGFTRTAVALGLALAFAVTVCADDPRFPAPTGDPTIVPPGTKLERLFDGGCRMTEGVAAGHNGMIYFSDITFTKFCKDPCGLLATFGDDRSGYTISADRAWIWRTGQQSA
jgi:gluconolactonase